MAKNDAFAKDSLKAKDLLIIIEAAKNAGVTHFSYNGLEIDFEPKRIVMPQPPPQPKPQDIDAGPAPLRIQEQQIAYDPLDEMMLIDPLSYEEEVSKRLEGEAS